MKPEIVIFPDPQTLAQEAADRFVQLARAKVAEGDRLSVALSGGSTPAPLYRRLAQAPLREAIPWQRVHLFWGDERCVPPQHPESNFGRAKEILIDHLSIPAGNVHRIRGELEPEAAALACAVGLHAFFGRAWPRFDLVLLGLGADGHTASLFPGSPILEETTRSVVPVKAQYQGRPAWRVTLTLPAINAARQVIFLVTGASKADVLQTVLMGPQTLPAQRVRPKSGQLTWLVDAEAARLIREHLPLTVEV